MLRQFHSPCYSPVQIFSQFESQAYQPECALNISSETPESLQKRIEAHSNNIGFVFGKVLREIWDQGVVPLYTHLRAAAEKFYDYVKSFQNQNDEIYAEGTERHMNAYQCDQCDQDKWQQGYPQSLILYSNYRRFRGEEIVQFFLKKSYSHKVFKSQLARRYHLTEKSISNVVELCEAIRDTSILGPINMLVIFGHGTPQEIALGSAVEHRISLEQQFGDSTIEQDLSCLKLLSKKVVIIISACNAAGSFELPLQNSTQTLPMNIQDLIASKAPGSTIFAPNFFIRQYSLTIEFTPTIRVYASGMEETLRDYPRALFELLVHDQIPFLSKMLLKPLSVISPNKPAFCQAYLPYLKMKAYCDTKGSHPHQSKRTECMEDPVCHQTAEKLKKMFKYG